MAQNLASKYSAKVVERFKLKSLTDKAVNNDYDWTGVNSVSVYSVATAAMGTYTRSGQNRYGTVTEVDTTIQTLTLARDRAFTKSIDRRNRDESMGVTEAGKFLARQLDEVITPEIDVYRLAALGTAASVGATTGATSAANAYSNFLATQTVITDKKVPLTGRIAFMTAQYYAFLKQSNFVLDSEDAMGARHSGNYGTVDATTIQVVPSSYMPTNVDLIITHPVAMVSPMVLESYKTHVDAPGINGWLVEGRVVYDAFVLTAKADAIAKHSIA